MLNNFATPIVVYAVRKNLHRPTDWGMDSNEMRYVRSFLFVKQCTDSVVIYTGRCHAVIYCSREVSRIC